MLNVEKYLKIKRMENAIKLKNNEKIMESGKILNFINYNILNNESWVKDKNCE